MPSHVLSPTESATIFGSQLWWRTSPALAVSSAASRVAKAAPDGYQFVIGNVGTFVQSRWLYKHPLYDPVTDFAPVALLTDESLVLVARNDLAADNLQQFISYAKANQGKLHYASSGVGGSNHLACMLLNSAIGIETSWLVGWITTA